MQALVVIITTRLFICYFCNERKYLGILASGKMENMNKSTNRLSIRLYTLFISKSVQFKLQRLTAYNQSTNQKTENNEHKFIILQRNGASRSCTSLLRGAPQTHSLLSPTPRPRLLPARRHGGRARRGGSSDAKWAHSHANSGCKFNFMIKVRKLLYYVSQVKLSLLEYNKLISILSCG